MNVNSYETKLTVDADGKPTAIASTAKVNILTGTAKAVINPLTLSDSVVTGPAAALGLGAVAYGTAAVQRMRAGLPFKFNAFSQE